MANAIGSLHWANRTHGKLSWYNKLTIVAHLAKIQVQRILLRQKPTNPAPFDIDSIVIPDSNIAKQACELCEEVSSEALALHCMRAYLFGSILGQQDGLHFDPELFFVMAQLHDLGLTDAYNQKDPTAACFAVEGARAAHAFCTEHGWTEARATTVNEAISLHLNIAVSTANGCEAHLLRFGSGLDVLGEGRWLIHADTRKAVLERYSRDGLVEGLTAAFEREHANRAHSRITFLNQTIGFNGRMQRAKL